MVLENPGRAALWQRQESLKASENHCAERGIGVLAVIGYSHDPVKCASSILSNKLCIPWCKHVIFVTKNLHKLPQLSSVTQFVEGRELEQKEMVLRNSWENFQVDEQVSFFSNVLKFASLHYSILYYCIYTIHECVHTTFLTFEGRGKFFFVAC